MCERKPLICVFDFPRLGGSMPCFGEASRGGPCSFFGPPSTSGGRGDSPTARQPGTLHCKLVCFTQACVCFTSSTRQEPRGRPVHDSTGVPPILGVPSPTVALRLALPRAQLPSAPPPPGLHSPRTLLALRWSSGRSSVGPAPVFWGGFPVSGLPALLLVGLLPFATHLGPPCFGGPSPLVRVVVPVRLFTPPSWLLQVGPPSLSGASGSSPGPVAFRPPPAPDRHSPQALLALRWSSGRSLVGPAARVLGRLSGLWPARPPSVWAPPLSHSLWVPLAFVGPPPLCGWWSPFAGSPLPAGSSKCD